MGAGWLVGVCINLVGSICINLGTNVMKMGHNRLAASPCSLSRPRPAIHKLREWQIGVCIFAAGNVANFVSFGYAAQSLLAAIGCVQFVSNVVFASWVLKEQVSRSVLAATACIVAGCVLLVSGGSHVSEAYTYKQLLRLYAQPAYISYMSVGSVAVVLAYAGYWAGQKAVISRGAAATPVWTAALPILYSIFSALIGTQSVLFSKTLAVLLRSTINGDNQLGKWFTWFVLLAFLTSAGFWITRLNKGLRMFPALIIVPSLQICWTLFSILSGMLYFQEYATMRPGPTAMFVIGVAVVFVGVFLLTHASQPHSDPVAQPAELKPLAGKTRIAFVGDEAVQGSTDAAAPGHVKWQLPAVRTTPRSGSSHELCGLLRGTAQLSDALEHQQEQQDAAGACEASEDEEEEEYERALLACTSGGPRSNSSHLGAHPQQQQQQRQPSLPVNEASTAAGGLLQQPVAPELNAAAPSRGTQRWLHKASSLKRRVALDFNLDETAAAKLSLGLGDSHTPGFSLFTMPMVLDLREIPSHEVSTWRSTEAVDASGRSYGRLPLLSAGGAFQQQDLPPLTVPPGLDETGCISLGGAAAASNPRGSFSAASFSWPPGGPSEPSDSGPAPAGPFSGINPLANAIDIRSTCSSGRNTPRSTAQEQQGAPSAAASKWKVIQHKMKLNVQDFKSVVQQAVAAQHQAQASKPYSRMGMTSKEEAIEVQEGGTQEADED